MGQYGRYLLVADSRFAELVTERVWSRIGNTALLHTDLLS